MQALLRKLEANSTAGRSTARRESAPAVAPCERLEDRFMLSASAPDLTNVYTGKMLVTAGGMKGKDVVSLALISQGDNGYLAGQLSSVYGGKVDVKGWLNGKSIQLVGATSGRSIDAVILKRGKVLKGTIVNGVDDSVGTFKLRVQSDSPASVPPASRTAGAMSFSTAAANSASANGRAIAPLSAADLASSAAAGDESVFSAQAITPLASGPGTQIGNNYSILGIYTGIFNFDGTGRIEDITTGSTTGTGSNGTVPGVNPRTAIFTTNTQDESGLVTGTLSIENFGTFNYSGFINGTQIDLVLSGPGPGVVTLTLSGTFDSFDGQITTAEANGFRAEGPIFASFTDTVPGGGGGSGEPLPDGEEIYHVDVTDTNGNSVLGNFDPNGQSLGMDFTVGQVPLIINSLGAFDDGADGLANTITVAIYNVSNPSSPIVTAQVTTANSELAPNSSFRYITTFDSVTLSQGVYRIVAYGYGGAELAGDVGLDTYTGPDPTFSFGTFFGSISYPGTNSLGSNNYYSNSGGTSITYPTLPDELPINRYLAGSFLFEEGIPPDPDGGGGPSIPPPPPTPGVIVKPGGSAYPGGVANTVNGPEVFGSQSGFIIP